jgi:RNA polymerase sigma factor (TIGR02999 family)
MGQVKFFGPQRSRALQIVLFLHRVRWFSSTCHSENFNAQLSSSRHFSQVSNNMQTLPGEITQLLLKWGRGDQSAFDQLIPLVYPELRKLARRYMGRENQGHTLQTSALINEAYLRLVDQENVEWQDRAHFFAVAARVMRHVLIDHARSHRSGKRGAGVRRVALEDQVILGQEPAAELLALDEALTSLAVIDPRKSRIVELRFFGGLTVEETAEVMKLSEVTIMREWRAAKAWLHREIIGE